MDFHNEVYLSKSSRSNVDKLELLVSTSSWQNVWQNQEWNKIQGIFKYFSKVFVWHSGRFTFTLPSRSDTVLFVFHSNFRHFFQARGLLGWRPYKILKNREMFIQNLKHLGWQRIRTHFHELNDFSQISANPLGNFNIQFLYVSASNEHLLKKNLPELRLSQEFCPSRILSTTLYNFPG